MYIISIRVFNEDHRSFTSTVHLYRVIHLYRRWQN
jgi:hypothetical protein